MPVFLCLLLPRPRPLFSFPHTNECCHPERSEGPAFAIVLAFILKMLCFSEGYGLQPVHPAATEDRPSAPEGRTSAASSPHCCHPERSEGPAFAAYFCRLFSLRSVFLKGTGFSPYIRQQQKIGLQPLRDAHLPRPHSKIVILSAAKDPLLPLFSLRSVFLKGTGFSPYIQQQQKIGLQAPRDAHLPRPQPKIVIMSAAKDPLLPSLSLFTLYLSGEPAAFSRKPLRHRRSAACKGPQAGYACLRSGMLRPSSSPEPPLAPDPVAPAHTSKRTWPAIASRETPHPAQTFRWPAPARRP